MVHNMPMRFLTRLPLALLFVLVTPGACVVSAQAPAAAADQTYKPSLTFDVASVRESAGGANGGLKVGAKSPLNSSTFEVTNFTTKILMQYAFGYGTPISGGPDWLTSVFYNVQARSDPSVDEQLARLTPAEQRLEKQHMVEVLLKERFKLKYHMEDREASVFALTQAKGGSKMQASKVDPDAPAPAVTGNGVEAHGGAQGLEFSAKLFSMTAITALLSSQLEQPVIDRTGLNGYFDFTLQIGPRMVRREPARLARHPDRRAGAAGAEARAHEGGDCGAGDRPH